MGKLVDELFDELVDKLEKEYKSMSYLYDKLCDEFVKQLSMLLEEKDVILASRVEYRVKTFESIAEKIRRNKLDINTISEINDLAGIRIVTLFKRDIDVVTNIISENFNVRRIEDTSERLSENQFGYGSIHFEVSAKDSWLSVPSLKPLEGLNVEIQVRTASQHIWAASSHILQYKHEKDVHPSVIRSINRAAALLEVIDLEFERVLNEREKYIEIIEKEGEFELLNVDSLRFLLDKLLPAENKKKNENYSELLEELMDFDIKTSDQLENLINNNYDQMMSSENYYRKNRKVYFQHVGLVREAMKSEFKEKFDEYQENQLSTKESD